MKETPKVTLNKWVLVSPVDEAKKNPLSHVLPGFEIIPMAQDEWKYQSSKGIVVSDSAKGLVKNSTVYYDYIANGNPDSNGNYFISIDNIRSYKSPESDLLMMVGDNVYVEKVDSVDSLHKSAAGIYHHKEDSFQKVKIKHVNSEGFYSGMEVYVKADFMVPETIDGEKLFRITIEDIFLT